MIPYTTIIFSLINLLTSQLDWFYIIVFIAIDFLYSRAKGLAKYNFNNAFKLINHNANILNDTTQKLSELSDKIEELENRLDELEK